MNKKIIFLVAINNRIGTGHVYRSLIIADELNKNNNKIIFMINPYEDNFDSAKKIIKNKYPIKNFNFCDIHREFPDLIILDVLNTTKHFIKKLKTLSSKNLKIISFEDIGKGNKYTNLTINDLYEKPLFSLDKKILWGDDYFILRKEFFTEEKNNFKENINSVLLFFGGTDPNNLTLKVYNCIKLFCILQQIKIHIIIGSGNDKNYLDIESGSNENINIYCGINNISEIMKNVDIAIMSNGRTAKESAHMQIPTITISHNKREIKHNCKKSGIINIGLYKNEKTIDKVLDDFIKLCYNKKARLKLFNQSKKLNYKNNLNKIISLIKGVIC